MCQLKCTIFGTHPREPGPAGLGWDLGRPGNLQHFNQITQGKVMGLVHGLSLGNTVMESSLYSSEDIPPHFLQSTPSFVITGGP